MHSLHMHYRSLTSMLLLAVDRLLAVLDCEDRLRLRLLESTASACASSNSGMTSRFMRMMG